MKKGVARQLFFFLLAELPPERMRVRASFFLPRPPFFSLIIFPPVSA